VDALHLVAHQSAAYWRALAKLGGLQQLDLRFYGNGFGFPDKPDFFWPIHLMTQLKQVPQLISFVNIPNDFWQ